jgi:hypothetical protein
LSRLLSRERDLDDVLFGHMTPIRASACALPSNRLTPSPACRFLRASPCARPFRGPPAELAEYEEHGHRAALVLTGTSNSYYVLVGGR